MRASRAGDTKAIKFVFDSVLGGNQLKGATFIQNNYNDGNSDPSKKTQAKPGSAKKISVMQRRVAGGLQLKNTNRNDDVNLG